MRFIKKSSLVNGENLSSGKFHERDLFPGDVLLYKGKGLFSLLIRLKTGGHYSHVELYVGNGTAWASRNGLGVNAYPLDLTDVIAVLRPKQKLNWSKAIQWFDQVAKGQGYDWLGLLNFYVAKWQGRENNKMFCSEFLVRVFREFDYPLFPETVDADGISPSDLPLSDKVRLIKGV